MTRALILAAVLPTFLGACASTPKPLDLTGISSAEIVVDGMTFDARVAGPKEGDLVLLLHGFPETSLEWRSQLKLLGAAGYRAVAPNQRGYSPRARPADVEAYRYPRLVDDVLGFADALGAETFHLVGHDWGAVVAWGAAARAPERIKSLTVFSIPHPDAFASALSDKDSCQFAASSYFESFTDDGIEHKLLWFDATPMRTLVYGDLDPAAQDGYLEVLGTPEALGAALNWYRANVDGRVLEAGEIGPVKVDTLFVWSDDDAAVCREPVDATAALVEGSYKLHVVEGVGHWIPESAPETVNPWLLAHIRSH